MRTQRFIQCHEGLNNARVTIKTEDLGSVVLVGVVGISNARSPGRLLLAKTTFDHDLPATLISPQRPWRCHDTPPPPPAFSDVVLRVQEMKSMMEGPAVRFNHGVWMDVEVWRPLGWVSSTPL